MKYWPDMAGFPTCEATDTDQLSAVMSTLARVFQPYHESIESMLQEIANAVRDCVPGAEQASISVARRGHMVQARADTGSIAAEVDVLQTELGDGPCLQALFEDRTIRVSDMSTERRWPRFAPAAYAAGIGSMLSIQLYIDYERLGALNAYSSTTRAFDAYSESVGLLFATHAAIAAAGAQHEEQHSSIVTSKPNAFIRPQKNPGNSRATTVRLNRSPSVTSRPEPE